MKRPTVRLAIGDDERVGICLSPSIREPATQFEFTA
jgi:hypothetical protein